MSKKHAFSLITKLSFLYKRLFLFLSPSHHTKIPQNMFSMQTMPSTTSVFSLYTTITAFAVLLRTVFGDIQSLATQVIPQSLREKIVAKLESLFGKFVSSSTLVTITIDESRGYATNEMYQAVESYLNDIIAPSAQHLKIFKQDDEMTLTAKEGEKIVDIFKGVEFTWEFITQESKKSSSSETDENRALQLCFEEIHKDFALKCYLPYIEEKWKFLIENKRVVKLHSANYDEINLNHPSTFETLAIEPALKKTITEDLDRFLRRKEFYRSVGKVWKRGYLLYGPPGTGKSSLIAAMANYLKFDIHDLELSSIRSDDDLRRHLVSIGNRSIIVIEDIDCGIELENRESDELGPGGGQITLSGLLNFVDGLWSGCGDERIIVFTTNYKEKLDPALLRPGRMDMHIHLSFLSPDGFRILAYNYLKLKEHNLFGEIEGLIRETSVTPAEVAEELMRSEDSDVALNGLIDFLQRKKCNQCSKVEEVKDLKSAVEEENDVVVDDDEKRNIGKRSSRKKRKKMLKGCQRSKDRKNWVQKQEWDW